MARRCLQLRLIVSRALDCLSQSTRGKLSVNSEADLLEPQEVHERRGRLDKVGCPCHSTAQRVRNPATVQEEVVKLTHRDRCERMIDSRVRPVWRFPCDARHSPITEENVRRVVLHDLFLCGLRGALAHARESAPHPASASSAVKRRGSTCRSYPRLPANL